MGGSRGPHVAVKTAIEGDVATVTLAGELDLDGVESVQAALERFVAGNVRDVAVDMAGLTFLDSSGLRAVLQARERLGGAGVDLRVERPSPVVRRVLDMTGTADLLLAR